MSNKPDFWEGGKSNPWERVLAISTAVGALGSLLAISDCGLSREWADQGRPRVCRGSDEGDS